MSPILGADAVGPLDQRGVEGDDIHEHAEPELFLEQPAGNAQLGEAQGGIEKQLHRVVAGLAVDIDAPGEVRGAGLLQPVIVGEPGILVGQGDEIPGPGMIQPSGRPGGTGEDLTDSGSFFEQGPHRGFEGTVVEVDMGHLMIGHREDPAGPGIQQLQAQLLPHRQPALLPEQAVEMHRAVDGGNAVLGQEDHGHLAIVEEVDQAAHDLIDSPQVGGDGGIGGPEPLQVVIEVGKVDQAQAGLVEFLLNNARLPILEIPRMVLPFLSISL